MIITTSQATDDALPLSELIFVEGGITMTQAARVADECFAQLGGRRAATHPTTPLRWAKKGHLRPDGTRVYLEVVRFGGKWLTSKAAIMRFIAAQQEAPPP